MDLESLQEFVTVCQEKKISEAAEKLFVSKQALSTSIRKLEEEVGAVLFVRSRSGMELTMEGEILYAKSLKMLEYWDRTKQEIIEVSQARDAKLSVGFGMMSIGYWNKELEDRFLAENPSVVLNVENEVSAMLREKLKRQEIDVMITGVKTEDPERYTRVLLRELDVYMIMNENDPLTRLDRVTPEDLRGRRLLFYSGSEWHMHAMNQYLRQRGIDADYAALPGNNYVVNIFKAASQNAILISNGMFRLVFRDIKGFAVRKFDVPEEEAPPGYGVYAMMLREREQEEKISRFVDFLRRRLPMDVEE